MLTRNRRKSSTRGQIRTADLRFRKLPQPLFERPRLCGLTAFNTDRFEPNPCLAPRSFGAPAVRLCVQSVSKIGWDIQFIGHPLVMIPADLGVVPKPVLYHALWVLQSDLADPVLSKRVERLGVFLQPGTSNDGACVTVDAVRAYPVARAALSDRGGFEPTAEQGGHPGRAAGRLDRRDAECFLAGLDFQPLVNANAIAAPVDVPPRQRQTLAKSQPVQPGKGEQGTPPVRRAGIEYSNQIRGRYLGPVLCHLRRRANKTVERIEGYAVLLSRLAKHGSGCTDVPSNGRQCRFSPDVPRPSKMLPDHCLVLQLVEDHSERSVLQRRLPRRSVGTRYLVDSGVRGEVGEQVLSTLAVRAASGFLHIASEIFVRGEPRGQLQRLAGGSTVKVVLDISAEVAGLAPADFGLPADGLAGSLASQRIIPNGFPVVTIIDEPHVRLLSHSEDVPSRRFGSKSAEDNKQIVSSRDLARLARMVARARGGQA